MHMDAAISKASALVEALSYIQRFHNKVVVVKVGGSIMDDEQALTNLLIDIVFLNYVGMQGLKAKMAHADSLRDSITVLDAKIDTAKRDIAKESVEDVKKRVAAYRASLALLRTLVPEQREVTNLLDDVTQLKGIDQLEGR